MQYRPKVRRDDLTIQEVEDDMVVYDGRHQRAHRLNSTAALVLRSSDGTRTIREIACRLPSDLPGSYGGEDRVWLALEQLAKADLLTEGLPLPPEWGLSRRALLQKAAAAALVLPIVETVLAPSPADAQSRPPGGGQFGSYGPFS